METAAAAIANIIAYNAAVARLESAVSFSEGVADAPTPCGLCAKCVRNWDLVGVCATIGVLAAYAASQFRM